MVQVGSDSKRGSAEFRGTRGPERAWREFVPASAAGPGMTTVGGAPRGGGVVEEEEETIGEARGEHVVIDDIPTSRYRAQCGHGAPLNNEDNQPLTPIPTDRAGPQLQGKMPAKGSFFNNSYKPVDLRELIMQAEGKTSSAALGTADTFDSGSDAAK